MEVPKLLQEPNGYGHTSWDGERGLLEVSILPFWEAIRLPTLLPKVVAPPGFLVLCNMLKLI